MTITVTPSPFLFSPHSFFSLRMKLQYHRTPLATPPSPRRDPGYCYCTWVADPQEVIGSREGARHPAPGDLVVDADVMARRPLGWAADWWCHSTLRILMGALMGLKVVTFLRSLPPKEMKVHLRNKVNDRLLPRWRYWHFCQQQTAHQRVKALICADYQ